MMLRWVKREMPAVGIKAVGNTLYENCTNTVKVLQMQVPIGINMENDRMQYGWVDVPVEDEA